MKKSKEEVIRFLKTLPEGRKIFFQLGRIMVQVSKEEALKLLEEGGTDSPSLFKIPKKEE
jgi:chaperonin cofactor prefoldin